MQNQNYEETEEGFWKKDKSQTRGASPFNRPIPPVRTAVGNFPIGKDGRVDWDLVAKEAQERERQRKASKRR